ncbi:MAG: hypothetical protein LBC61_06865 [Candidatus Peribacteria bacterium]|nr:hypothetical protein [Candidatus Peribacteria bacterium]
MRGSYNFLINFKDNSLSVQYIILSGVRKSFIALHCLKNSGLDAISKSSCSHLFLISFLIISLHIYSVPTGVVDLFMNNLKLFIYFQKDSQTFFIYSKLVSPFSDVGVQTAEIITSPKIIVSLSSDVNLICHF